jgi:hypothetical protein
MSSMVRSALFFTTNVSAGPSAAVDAMLVEFVFRFVTSGFYGALTQALSRLRSERDATLTAMIVLPIVGQGVEFIVHWLNGTPNLAGSIAASAVLTAASTAFNVFAMRRGVLIVGTGSRSLRQDLAMMPSVMAAFLFSWRSKRYI